jgi:hypothetical protein
MQTLDERVTVLETRVDELSVRCDDTAQDAASARDAHRHNTTLLNAVRTTQAEHSRTLAEHGRTLAEHSRTLAEHDRRFDAIDATLAEHTTVLGKLMVGMHGIQLSLKHVIDREGNGSHEDSAH